MKKLIFFFVLLYSFVSASAEDDILFDQTSNSIRMIQTKEVPFALSKKIPINSLTIDLAYVEEYLSDTTILYCLKVNIPSDRPYALPYDTKLLLKGKEGKVVDLTTDVEKEVSDCKTFDAYGEDQWHISYTFYLNEKQILALARLDIFKLRFQIPWNKTFYDIEKSKFDNFGFSGSVFYLYNQIQKQIKISKNIYEDF